MILPSFTFAVKWTTSIPVIPRTLFVATLIAFCAAASQLSGEDPISSITLTTLTVQTSDGARIIYTLTYGSFLTSPIL